MSTPARDRLARAHATLIMLESDAGHGTLEECSCDTAREYRRLAFRAQRAVAPKATACSTTCATCATHLKPGQVRFTYYGEKDRHGKYSFAIEWLDTPREDKSSAYLAWVTKHPNLQPGRRAQHFYGDPAPYLDKARTAGDEVLEQHEPALSTRRRRAVRS